MLRFYYDPKYKYTNRNIINLTDDANFSMKDYVNIDSPDTINGHIIYELEENEIIPTYIVDNDTNYSWFVTGITQLRTGKFQISLLRDVISEDTRWKNEASYVQAGTAIDYNRYKKWGLPFTNTKVKQERLPINGKSSFFVFYVNTQSINAESGVLSEKDLKIKTSSLAGVTNFDYTFSNLNEIPGFGYVSRDKNNLNYYDLYSNNKLMLATTMDTGNGIFGSDDRKRFIITSTKDNIKIGPALNITDSSNWIYLNTLSWKVANNENNCLNDLKSGMEFSLSEYKERFRIQEISNQEYKDLEPYVNKFILDSSSSKVYIIKKYETEAIADDITVIQPDDSPIIPILRNINFPIHQAPEEAEHLTYQGPFFEWSKTKKKISYYLEELGSAKSFDFNFIANTRKLPKSAVRCVNIVSDDTLIDSEIAQSLMVAQTNPININNDTGRILDIQYLPFSIATQKDSNFTINGNQLTAQFLDTDDYSYQINLPDLTDINKETDTIKIVSPSRASQFMFSPYNNDGNMEFDIKITLKPNASIIYVRPSTQGLLLADWDDKDCLIIQEDFSLTNVTSSWTNYIYNNKNYQNTFNRQIQGRELYRSWERRVEEANAKADEWTARNISAQKAKTYTGNQPVLGGIAGAIGSAWKDTTYMEMAKVDREYNEAIYQETINISRDMFKMQLENIQAQPNIPTSITTIDVKLLDGIYLEYYSTNSTEKRAIQQFYKFNGNRIDCYGTFNEFWGDFIRGRIIISQYYTQPEINELNRRLENGIFTKEIK